MHLAKLVEPLLRPMALAAFVVLDGSLLAPRRAPQPPPELRAGARRRGAPCMVSERHNLAYKETMKLFDRLPVDAPLNRFPLVSYVKGDDVYHGGDHLVHATAEPLLTKEECDAIIAESEEWAEREGGWTSKRHFNHPTTDIPLAELPRTREFLNTDALPSRIYPMLGHAFENSLPNWRALRVADAFVVKYNATAGQSFLKPHRDGSVVSFNIALNDMSEYEGGGTWIARLARDDPPGSIRSDRGHVLAHASGMLHGGHEVESGVRYILVCFVILKNFANFATRFYQAVRDQDPEEFEPLPPGIEGVDSA